MVSRALLQASVDWLLDARISPEQGLWEVATQPRLMVSVGGAAFGTAVLAGCRAQVSAQPLGDL